MLRARFDLFPAVDGADIRTRTFALVVPAL